MKVIAEKIPGLLLFEPRIHKDARGHFLEVWKNGAYPLPNFIQDNISVSSRGVVRGMHLQHPNGQGKLVTVLEGEVFDVALDVRRNSPSFGQWTATLLSGENYHQFYIPPGFAHGFCVLSPRAVFFYKVTAPYDPASELTVLWNDRTVGIEWPVDEPLLSEKDLKGIPLAQVPIDRLPEF